MTKDELKALGLTDEQADKVVAGYKDFIPKARFDEVNAAKKKAEDTLKERDTQLDELRKSNGDAETLKTQIEQLQKANKAAEDKYAADLKALQIGNAVDKELTAAGAKNLKAVKALLELKDAELDGESVKGLAKQIKSLQDDEKTKFLFNAQSGAPIIKGMTPPGSGDNQQVDPAKMTYSQMIEYQQTHPDAKIF